MQLRKTKSVDKVKISIPEYQNRLLPPYEDTHRSISDICLLLCVTVNRDILGTEYLK